MAISISFSVTRTLIGTTGDVSGRAAARAGYSAGDDNPSHSVEFSQSGNQAQILALESTTGNTNVAGVDSKCNPAAFRLRLLRTVRQFSDPDSTDTHTSTFQSAGSGYLGTFALDAANETTRSDAWHFTLNSNEVNPSFDPAAAQPRQQFYDVTISDDHSYSSAKERLGLSVGSTASDTFAFAPGAGQELVFNFATQGSADKIELDHFGVSTFNQLVLQAINNNHDTLVDLGHGDSVTVVGVHPTDLNSAHFVFT